MSKPVHTKIFSSDALDELLSVKSKHNSGNWLLRYLDVFVLVVMLMVTLVTIGDFNHQAALSEQKAKNDEKIKGYKARLKAASGAVLLLNHTEKMAEITPLPAEKRLVADNSPPAEPPPVADDEAAMQARLQQELTGKIAQLGLQNSIKMSVGKGFAQFDIQDKVLFESSTAELTGSGKTLLARLIPLLKESDGFIIIEGHTDNRPIKHSRFLSNWELSALRATGVVHYLAAQHIEQGRLRATSYADTKPIADNETKEGREKNRRVNIVIQVDNKAQANAIE
ncbi:MAG: OmpA family protein [Methylococcales bacterium]|nr:OmpA family protein [Methylococcales bacterium]